jgi:hypothetical protein
MVANESSICPSTAREKDLRKIIAGWEIQRIRYKKAIPKIAERMTEDASQVNSPGIKKIAITGIANTIPTITLAIARIIRAPTAKTK